MIYLNRVLYIEIKGGAIRLLIRALTYYIVEELLISFLLIVKGLFSNIGLIMDR